MTDYEPASKPLQWFDDSEEVKETIAREQAYNEKRSQELDAIHEELVKMGQVDYSQYFLSAPFPGPELSLWKLLGGTPKRRVEYMAMLRRNSRWYRRAWRHAKRTTYPLRHPLKAYRDRIIERYCERY